MSRTIRRKNETWEYSWVLRDWNDGWPYYLRKPNLDQNSSAGKLKINKYHRDNDTSHYKEPGPSWFRNLETERPQRREAKRQLRKYLQGEDIEVILNPKDPLDYWT